MLRRLGAVQLDTISSLARSHELVAYSRLGALRRGRVEAAYWGTPPQAFEYWAHAACIIPIESWPWFAAERRRRRAHPHRRELLDDRVITEVRARLLDSGPQTVAELGGGRLAEGWWNWSPVKVAVEELYNLGEVVCVSRRGWRRVYDLANRAIPADLLAQDQSDEQCYGRLVTMAVMGLGVAAERDLQHYFSLSRGAVVAGLAHASGLTPVRVEGWPGTAWTTPAALGTLSGGGPRGRHRTTLLSPFDSLLWDRARVLRMFGFQHKLEAYVPAPKRVHGYYTMPLLSGGRLVGRVDPGRAGSTLVARQVSLAPGAEGPMARALVEAASWVGCDGVVVERLEPEGSRDRLERGIAELA